MIRINEEKTAQIAEKIQEEADKINELITEMGKEQIHVSKIWVSEASDLTQEKMEKLTENCGAIKQEMIFISDTIQSILQRIQMQNERDLQEVEQLWIGGK